MMTIPINILQSMISRNKDNIRWLEGQVKYSKWYITFAIPNNHWKVRSVKFEKELKALVAIQKALKKEMAEKVRCAAYFKWQTEVSRKMWNMTRITRRDS